jgi:hypothetical protein
MQSEMDPQKEKRVMNDSFKVINKKETSEGGLAVSLVLC